MGYTDLINHIRTFVNQTRGVFILDSVDYLYKGGRCSAVEHFVSSLLKIRPLLEICSDGTLGVLRMVQGKRSNAVNSLRDYILDQIGTNQINQLIITHLNCGAEAAYLEREIKLISKNIRITTARVGCVLAMHSGPNPIGIAYSVN
jgi:DegV family protein with EDD domain